MDYIRIDKRWPKQVLWITNILKGIWRRTYGTNGLALGGTWNDNWIYVNKNY